MLKASDVTMLGDDSPLQMYLKEVDDLVKYQHGWAMIHRHLPVEAIYEGFLDHLGHPVPKRQVDEDEVKRYSKWLAENGEPVFANIIEGLRSRGKHPHAIRITMMFLLANLEYLKEREANEGRNRSIDDGSDLSAYSSIGRASDF